MKVTATIENTGDVNIVSVQSNGNRQQLAIPGKTAGHGSSVNGGELLCAALATCFCNDLYREANKRDIRLTKVIVVASAEFPAEGAAGMNITYRPEIEGDASEEELIALIKYTDTVAEIHNTIRSGVNVTLEM